MKKLEKRAILCLLLAAVLFLGLCLYVYRFVKHGDEWATYYYNSHIFTDGNLATGSIYDRNDKALLKFNDGNVKYCTNPITRRAIVHAVGDTQGNIATSATSAFKDKLVGYNKLTGTYSITGEGNELKLSIDRDICRAAYQALAGRNGCVGIYNYENGEVICMVSTPSYDPVSPPDAGNAESGTFMNKFLSGTLIPGSIFKLVTSAAVIEEGEGIDLNSWSYHCTGSREVNGEKITCTYAHGTVDFDTALARSCNCAYAELTEAAGARTMKKYVKKLGLTERYEMNGVYNAAGSFEFPSATLNMDWAGIGQWKDQLNPCSMLVYMGAIARDGRSVAPVLIHDPLIKGGRTDRMIEPETAEKLREMMRNNVKVEYGESNYPGLEIYAKSGTAEGNTQNPNAWFCGFIKNEGFPYAFIVCVEDSGYGSAVAGPVANRVLQKLVKTPSARS